MQISPLFFIFRPGNFSCSLNYLNNTEFYDLIDFLLLMDYHIKVFQMVEVPPYDMVYMKLFSNKLLLTKSINDRYQYQTKYPRPLK